MGVSVFNSPTSTHPAEGVSVDWQEAAVSVVGYKEKRAWPITSLSLLDVFHEAIFLPEIFRLTNKMAADSMKKVSFPRFLFYAQLLPRVFTL